MLLLLGTRNVYYLYKRFKDWHLSEEAIDNDDMIIIYVEELLFNFVIFYNIANQNKQTPDLNSIDGSPKDDAIYRATTTRGE